MEHRAIETSKAHGLQRRAHELIPGGAPCVRQGRRPVSYRGARLHSRRTGLPRVGSRWQPVHQYGMGNRAVGLGHAYAPVIDAARNELANGCNFTRPSPIEVACAEQFLVPVDTVEMVKFCKDGCNCDVRRNEAGARLHRARYDRVLRRSPVLLDGRLVYRHDRDECQASRKRCGR